MATLGELRTGLKNQLATISGLNAYDVWPDSVVTPAAIVEPSEEQWHQAMGGSGGHSMARFDIVVVVSIAAGLSAANGALDAYLSKTGSSSIRAAIEADLTLNKKSDTLTVTGWRDYGDIEINGEQFLGARVMVEVWNA